MAFLLFTLFMFSPWSITSALQCLDSQGHPVDWFIFYKLPELKSNKSNPMLRDGLGHFYMDANTQKFQLSKYSLNGSHDAAYYTLQQIYSSKDTPIFYAMYNDQPPNTSQSLNHGHTKGVVGFDQEEGFWLVHSVPKYPPLKKDGYYWHAGGDVNGQNFLCVTYKSTMIDVIGQQFFYNYPKFFDNNLNNTWPKFATENPYMTQSVNRHHTESEPWRKVVKLISKAGGQFISFAKTKEFGQDLYDGWLTQYFQSDMYTETWLNGQGKLNSNCSTKFKVHNINQITLPEGIYFNNTQDHSKWAITTKGYWVCSGDINRESTQERRAGGTVCFQNKHVWQNYNNSIGVLEPCPKHFRYNVIVQ